MKPAFWNDSRLAALPESTRLFYIGLWMIADDAGWLRWDAVEVARDLYGYETRTRRERRVGTMFVGLVESGRVILHPCGHAEIPKMPEHQRLAGPTRQVRTEYNAHSRDCLRAPADPRTSPLSPARNGKEQEQVRERSGTVRNGTRAQARDDDDERSEFDRLMEANGGQRPTLVRPA